ncbi:MAG: hypothetical protein E7513_05970 [Ruminococcaceae bacterium]|nr:hypothetical protein [Oscillospiraceae bacterium]
MLKFEFTDINDKVVIVKNPLSLLINIEEDVPADDMTVVFEYFDTDELKEVRVVDNDEVIFTGIVDEISSVCESSGRLIRIVCRSMAAKLLDNESVPVSYTHPSVSVISSRHIKPFGLSSVSAEDTTYFGTQTVLKGASNWQAVSDFSKNVYGATPRVNVLGEVEFFGAKENKETIFSNGTDGIRYTSLTETIKRCEEISKVYIKVINSSGYNNTIENADALKRGIERERYLNAVLTDTPAQCADKMIKNGRDKSYVVTLVCPGRHLNIFANSAVVEDSMLSRGADLYVSGLRYQLNSKNDETVVILKRKEV